MAKPIKITPVLRGRDAINFYTKLEENKTKKVDIGFVQAAREAAEKLLSRTSKSK